MVDDAAVFSKLEELTKGIIGRANEVTGANVEWLQQNLSCIGELLERIKAWDQVPAEAYVLMEKTSMLIRRLEDVIDTAEQKTIEMQTAAAFKKPIYDRNHGRYLKKEIMNIKMDIINVVRPLQYLVRYGNFNIASQLYPASEQLVPVYGFHRDFPLYLRKFLYYFLLFPRNFEIPVRRLIFLWVAEGLVSRNEGEEFEQVAYHYLCELRHLETITCPKPNHNGKLTTCRLVDSKRDAVLQMAREANFFHDDTRFVSRLVDHNGASRSSCFIYINAVRRSTASYSNYRQVRSFLSFNIRPGRSKPGADIGDFLDKCISAGCFQFMRVLDLERILRPKLPKALSRLTLLRYLGLRYTYVDNLPDFVNKLINLQVLDLKHTYISLLPASIWRMKYLRHLYLTEFYRTRIDGQPSNPPLNNLQTLWGLFIDENTAVEGGLDALVHIRKLGLSCLSGSSEPMKKKLEAVCRWISRMTSLESLRLKSRDEDGEPSELYFRSLKHMKKLSSVYLFGRLDSLVVEYLPDSLIELTLSGSKLGAQVMEFLGSLQKLQVLRLLAQSVVDTTMECKTRSFPLLKVLKIWKLGKLEEWKVEEGSLTSLEELEIRSCDQLKRLPDRLRHITTLKNFSLTCMPAGFIDELKRNQSQLWDDMKNVLKVE